MSHGRDVVRTAEIAAELENVRLAWHYAVESGEAERLGRAINTLANFYLYHGPVDEGIALLEPVICSLRAAAPNDGRDRLLAEALHEQAWLHLNCGRYATSRAELEETQQLYGRLGVQAPNTGRASDPRAGLPLLALFEGDYPEAGRLAEAYLQLSLAEAYHVQPFAWFLVATAIAQGLYRQARHAAEQAYAAVQVKEDRWFEAYVLIDLGRVAQCEGRYQEARRYFQASYAIHEAFGDPEGKALALFYEGMVALHAGAPAESADLFARSLAIYRIRSDVRGLAEAQMGQGMAQVALGKLGAAVGSFRVALALAREVALPPLTLAILVGASELLIENNRLGEARAVLTLALRHPAAECETSARAAQILLTHEAALMPGAAAGAASKPTPADVDTAVAQLLGALAAWERG